MRYLFFTFILFFVFPVYAVDEITISPVISDDMNEEEYYNLKNEARINELYNRINELENHIKTLDAMYIELKAKTDILLVDENLLPEDPINNDPEFQYAFNMLTEAQYDKSYRAFKLFIEKYPDDVKVGQAYFWLGEISYKNEDYIDASKNYLVSYRDYRDNNERRNDALFKLSVVLGLMNKKSEACSGFDILIYDTSNIKPALKNKAINEAVNFGCSN